MTGSGSGSGCGKRALGVAALILATIMGCKPRNLSEVRETPPSNAPATDFAFDRELFHLVSTSFAHVTPLLSARAYDNLPQVWDADAQKRYAEVPNDTQAKRAFIAQFYGLVMPPADLGQFPMGLTPSGTAGNESLRSNCLICHASQVFGKPVVGLGNNTLDFEGFILDTIKATEKLGEPLTPWLQQYKTAKKYDISFGKTRGTTAPLTFAGILLKLREKNLKPKYNASQLANIESVLSPLTRLMPRKMKENTARKLLVFQMPDMDLDAPSWWLTSANDRLYNDGLIDKDARPVLQFLADPWAKPADIIGKEPDARTFIDKLNHMTPPPAYAEMFPDKMDKTKAAEGAKVFAKNCARCHGHYGATKTEDEYPGTILPAAVIGTDAFRAQNMTAEFRNFLNESWFGAEGKLNTSLQPSGYRAPYLRGVAYTYPYFHNGSVPTLYHVLFPKERPDVWRALPNQFDHEKMGFLVSTDPMPANVSEREKRFYFDTRLEGKGNDGHDAFIEARRPKADSKEIISREDRLRLLEYLKTL